MNQYIGQPMDPYKREYPLPYMMEAIERFRIRNGKLIVEIGSMRQLMNHSHEEVDINCCMDGHSSYFLSRADGLEDFYSVDIDPNCTKITSQYIAKGIAVTGDGIRFLRMFTKKIDLLYLDAWDVDLDDSAEKHLEAFKIAEKNLHDRSMILIDDTDVDKVDGKIVFADGLSGKGKLVIPYAIEKGYEVIFSGRQTLLSK